jgi:hypothetical protein
VHTDDEANSLPEPGWPPWIRRDSGWYFTLIGGIATVLLLLMPQLSGFDFAGRIAAAIFVLVFTLLFSIWLCAANALQSGYCKLRAYDRLYTRYSTANEALSHATELNRRYALERAQYELVQVLWYDETLFIQLRKKPGPPLELGAAVAVLDSTDGALMGRFRISEVKQREYIARADGYLNALWLGFVRQSKQSVSPPPPNTVAVIVPQQEQIDE